MAIALIAACALLMAAVAQQEPPPGVPVGAANATQRLVLDHAAQDELPPIPLDPSGSTEYGIVFDGFRLAIRVARAAAAAGRPLEHSSPELTGHKIVVVAFPREVAGHRLFPHAIEMLNKERAPVAKLTEAAGEEAARLAHWSTLPPDALAAQFDLTMFGMGQLVRIAYRDERGAAAGVPVELAAQLTPPKKTHDVSPRLPPGGAVPLVPVTVVVSGALDTTGRVRYPRVVSGPLEYAAAALEAVAQWVFEPARVNGAPINTVITVTVVFSTR